MGPEQKEPMTKETKRELVLVSGLLGLAMLGYDRFGYGFTYGLSYLIQRGYLTYSYNLVCIIQIFYSVLCVLLPFLIVSFFIRKIQHRERDDRLAPFGAPPNRGWFIASLGIGYGALILANFVTSIFTQIIEGQGFVIDSYEMESPTTLSGYIWLVLADAVVPAIVEELAMRGIVMQSLRKYGDAFAIGFSSLLFAVLHGNMSQAPFALMLGAAIGYLVVKTGTLWTGITIHLINNTYAVVMFIVREETSITVAATCSAVLSALGLCLGFISIAYLLLRRKGRDTEYQLLNPGGNTFRVQRIYRLKAWFYAVISLPMLGALIYLGRDLVLSIHR